MGKRKFLKKEKVKCIYLIFLFEIKENMKWHENKNDVVLTVIASGWLSPGLRN